MPDVRSLRIPLRYLANLLTAGKEEPVALALERMLAMRAYMRSKTVEDTPNLHVLQAVGLTPGQVEEMYRYLAIANYEDRCVVPSSHREYASATFDAYSERGGCGFTFGNCTTTGNTESNLFGAKRTNARQARPIKVKPQ